MNRYKFTLEYNQSEESNAKDSEKLWYHWNHNNLEIEAKSALEAMDYFEIKYAGEFYRFSRNWNESRDEGRMYLVNGYDKGEIIFNVNNVSQIVKNNSDHFDSRSGLNLNEEQIIKDVNRAWDIFKTLEQTHPSDKKDFCDAVHQIQKIIGMRVLRRDYPEYWINKGE